MRPSKLCVTIVTSLILSVPAMAATTTKVLDFEDLPSGAFNAPTVVTQSYVLDGTLSQYNPAILTEPPGTNSGNVLGLCLGCGDVPEGVSIYRYDGNVFELDSLDLDYLNIVYTADVTGHLSGGGTVTTSILTTGTFVFDSSWVGLSSIDIVFDTPSSSGFEIVFIDNVTLQAVPVPGAVWLLGSALAGLGWLRRRQSRPQSHASLPG